MARIVGGIGASHAPSMEHVYDAGEGVRGSDEWQPLFGPFSEVAQWLEGLRPDRLIVVYNDHMDEFFLNAYPTFALGVADSYPVADEGFGARPFPPLPGDAAFGWHIARSLVADEFDITICQELEVDHGVISPLPMVDFAEGEGGWKIPIVPLAVNVILHPLPSPLRCWKLGRAIRHEAERRTFNILDAGEGIRATVIGASQYTVQLSGETIFIPETMTLPVRNLRVFVAESDWQAPVLEKTAVAVARTLGERDPEVRGAPFVLAFSTPPFTGYGAVQEMARGIDRALENLPADDRPVALVFVHNIGQVVGGMLSSKWNMPCIDEVSLSELDFIDIGEVVESEGFVPVVIKSLAFGV